MGYDMYVCREHGGGIADLADLSLEEAIADTLTYCRRSIWSMGPLRDAMEQVRFGDVTMAYWANGEYPYPGEDATEEDLLAWLRSTADERPGIPLHKLCSNDGWWVTSAECQSALHIWERAGMPMDEEFGDDWIPFLRSAAEHGGFRVY